jgi:rod shape determining protein RodA
MGIMPVIGIPLPFISSGGSSLLGFSMLVGILLSMDSSWVRSRRVM